MAEMPPLDPRWRVRRRIVVCTLLYCGGHVSAILAWGSDSALHTQIGLGLLGLAGGVIGSYVFGAVWDDKGRA